MRDYYINNVCIFVLAMASKKLESLFEKKNLRVFISNISHIDYNFNLLSRDFISDTNTPKICHFGAKNNIQTEIDSFSINEIPLNIFTQ
jgi:hypothetical protein